MHEYWCIDDDSSTSVSGVTLLNKVSNEIKITLREPRSLKDTIADIKTGSPAGLILDLRLDEVPSQSKYLADYRAGTLAQQLRSYAAEGSLPDIPIILWSSAPNLKKSYDNDTRSHDLFDEVLVKNRLVDEPKNVARRLWSYADGYQQISLFRTKTGGSLTGLIKAEADSADYVNTIVLSAISWDSLKGSTGTTANWILRYLMRSPGPLIDESVLAARLGVNPESSQDWPVLRDKILSPLRYVGPFGEAMPRWWALNLEKWWAELKTNIPLSLTTALDRVKALSRTTDLQGLVPAVVQEKGLSDQFWYVCEKSGVPLDAKDGLALIDEELTTWNEAQYVSIAYALTDSKVPLQPLERDRLAGIKAALSK